MGCAGPKPRRGQRRAVAADRRGDRPVLYRIAFQPLAHASVLVLLIASVGVPFGDAGARPGVLRRRGPARPGAVGRAFTLGPLRFTGQSLAVFGAHDRLHRRALAVLRAHADRQGAARHRRQPARRAAGRHPHLAVGTDRLRAGLADRRALRRPDRADHDDLLRHRLPDRPEGLRRRDHRRAGQLSADRGGGARGRHAWKPSPRSTPAPSRK